MIDAMTATLKREQLDDDSKKEYCAAQFDVADDKKKGLERSISDHETDIASTEEGISSAKDDIKALGASIKALDKAVAEATSQRKEQDNYFSSHPSDKSAYPSLAPSRPPPPSW